MSSMPARSPNTPSSGCRLVSLDGRVLPLTRVTLRGEAGGGLAQVVVEQTFRNPHAEPLTATYQLPLPADGAVVDFAFRIGDRRIVGEIDRKADARARFEEAVLEGRTAALLEQERSSVFTQEIGNIPPGQAVVAEISVECPLKWRERGWEWRFPTVVAPRFMGSAGQTPDADRVTVDVADGGVSIPVELTLEITDVLTGAPASTSHILDTAGSVVRLPVSGRLDRDLVVRWPVAAADPGVALEVGRSVGSADAFGLLTVVPPTPEGVRDVVPRDLIVLLDTSGSMGGRPLDQAKAFVRALIRGLEPRDRLEMIEFSTQPSRWSPHPVTMDARGQARAVTWLEGLRARGGTYMHTAIQEALAPLRAEAQRQVVLVSDGLIGFEHEVIGAIRHRLPAGSRVHTIGVGSGVNRSLTSPCARAGGGVELVVGLDEDVSESVAVLLARTGHPLVVDLEVSGDAILECTPAKIPDLFAAAPTSLHLRLRPEGGEVLLRGRTAAGPWEAVAVVPPVHMGDGRRAVITRFAREKVEDLEVARAAGDPGVDAQIEAIGLQHRIATRMTSWLAITHEATVDPTRPTRREAVPHALPYGMSAEGVGLRAPAGPPTLLSVSAAPMPGAPPALRRPARKQEAAKGRRDEAQTGFFARARRALGGAGRSVSDDDAFSAEEADAPAALPPAPPREAMATEGPRRPAPVVRFVARVILRRGGKLVVEVEAPRALEWNPSSFTAVFADGRRLSVTASSPTTAPGPIAAGARIRVAVALADDEPMPSQLVVDGPGGRVELSVVTR